MDIPKGTTRSALSFSIALAYEVFCGITDSGAMRDAPTWDQATFGVIPVSLAVSKAMGLDLERMGHALSLAASSHQRTSSSQWFWGNWDASHRFPRYAATTTADPGAPRVPSSRSSRLARSALPAARSLGNRHRPRGSRIRCRRDRSFASTRDRHARRCAPLRSVPNGCR
jgi:hypothetical protein